MREELRWFNDRHLFVIWMQTAKYRIYDIIQASPEGSVFSLLNTSISSKCCPEARNTKLQLLSLALILACSPLVTHLGDYGRCYRW